MAVGDRSEGSGSIAHFLRELLPPPPPPPGTPEAPPGPPPRPGSPLPPGGPAPEPSADTLAPSISGLGLTNWRFRVGPHATPLAARRVPVGTRFRYALSEPARVTIAIERARPGRRAGGRCRKPSRRLRSRPPCNRYSPAGRALTRAGKAGPNALAFSGRIGQSKLRPGAYRAGFEATDAAGNHSPNVRVRFRIDPTPNVRTR